MQREDDAGDRPEDSGPDSGTHDGGHEDTPHPDDGATSDEAAWQAIVANFGDRAVLDPDEGNRWATATEATDPRSTGSSGTSDFAVPEASSDEDHEQDDEDDDRFLGPADRFVPPEPPPVPLPPADRLAAWIGVFGSPAVLLICLVAAISIPTWLGWLLVGGFIGGFLYLVARTPGSPRDPWDDGSRV